MDIDKLEIRTPSRTITCHSTDRLTDKLQYSSLRSFCALRKFRIHFRVPIMPCRRHLDVQELSRAVGMLQGRQDQRQVADQFVVSHSVISRAWTRYQQTGRVNRRHAGSRHRATTAAQDRYLITSAARNRFSNATRLQRNLREASGTTISTQTVRNRLHDAGFRARRPAVRVPLIGRHRQERLLWCQDHVDWTPADWALVLFTDESRFCMDFHDGRNRVWRRPNERYCDATVAEHDRYGGGSVMVWTGISLSGRTDLYVIENGSLTGVRYRDEILHNIVTSYAGATGPDFILMDDNARPHRAGPMWSSIVVHPLLLLIDETDGRTPDRYIDAAPVNDAFIGHARERHDYTSY